MLSVLSMLTDSQYFGLAIIFGFMFLFICVLVTERLQVVWRGRAWKRVLYRKRLVRRFRA